MTALAAAALMASAVALVSAPGARPLPDRLPAPAAASPEVAGRRRSPPIERRWPRPLASAAGALLCLALLPGLWAGAAGLVVAVALWRWSATWEPAGVQRRRAAVQRDLPHVVDLMVALLTVGHSPEGSLRRVAAVTRGPVHEELELWCARVGLGADPCEVWRAMAAHPELGRLGAALQRATESGAPVREALERLADDLREGLRADVEERIRAVEVRTAVPLAVCLLPAFVLLAVVPLVAGTVLHLVAG